MASNGHGWGTPSIIVTACQPELRPAAPRSDRRDPASLRPPSNNHSNHPLCTDLLRASRPECLDSCVVVSVTEAFALATRFLVHRDSCVLLPVRTDPVGQRLQSTACIRRCAMSRAPPLLGASVSVEVCVCVAYLARIGTRAAALAAPPFDRARLGMRARSLFNDTSINHDRDVGPAELHRGTITRRVWRLHSRL